MLFNNTKEISQIIPTSKFAKIDNLISRLNAEEMSSLYPLVGMELLEQLREDYKNLSNREDGIWAELDPEDNKTKILILRTAQEILLFTYLANDNAILQTSFNMGGGWNKASTGDYEALDVKDNDRLDKNLWQRSLKAKETLLLYLEMDARNDQVYTSLWKESEYYYKHSDLLFTTSSELHPNYIDLGDKPHLTFHSYISTLHDCQDGYIAGTIGYTLLQALIDRKYSANTPQNELEDVSENEEVKVHWRTLDRHIRTALANFAVFEKGGAKQEHIRNRGQSQLSIATRYIHEHYSTFSQYIPEGTPIYVPPKENPEGHKPSDKSHQHHCKPPHKGTVFSLLH